MRTATSDSGITVFKQAVDQAPMLRGSRDFASVATYQMFLNKLFTSLNAGRQERYLEEVAKLQRLPEQRLDTARRERVSVSPGSLVTVHRNYYSVHSRPSPRGPELQTSLGSAEILGVILTKLGSLPSFRYEKYRTEMRSQGEPGVVTVDETPIGNFLELEGPPEWIDAKAAALGFTPSDYILESYGRLYLADCERRGVEPSNMVFPPDSP